MNYRCGSCCELCFHIITDDMHIEHDKSPIRTQKLLYSYSRYMNVNKAQTLGELVCIFSFAIPICEWCSLIILLAAMVVWVCNVRWLGCTAFESGARNLSSNPSEFIPVIVRDCLWLGGSLRLFCIACMPDLLEENMRNLRAYTKS